MVVISVGYIYYKLKEIKCLTAYQDGGIMYSTLREKPTNHQPRRNKMKKAEATNPANENKINTALANMFDMKLDMIGFDAIDEEEGNFVVWSTSPMFDTVVVSFENLDI